MLKKHPQVNHVDETENVKWCVFKVPQYIYERTLIHLALIGDKLSKGFFDEMIPTSRD